MSSGEPTDAQLDLERVLDALSDLVLIKGPRSRLLWANRAFLDFYGMTNEQLRDLIDGPQSDPDDTVHYVRDDHRVFTTGEPLDVPSEAITNHRGETHYFHTLKSAVRDPSGRVVQTVGVSRQISSTSRDVLDRRSRKEALSHMKALVAGIPLPVVMCDTSHRVIEQSDAWATFTGHHEPRADTIYDDAFESIVPAVELIRQVIADDGEVRRAGVECRPRGSSDRTADLHVRAWRLPDGNVGGAIVVAHDVTEATRTRSALERANDELVQFSYRASHDLRGPLRTTLGFLNLIESKIRHGASQEALPLIERASGRLQDLSHLVEDLLTLARADLDEMVVQSLAFSEVLEESLHRHREELDAAPMTVTRAIEADRISSDPVRLGQILDNLISNAIKYRDPHQTEGALHIHSRCEDGRVVVEVSDRGIGFKNPKDAFRSFSREGSEPSGASAGVGLGLAIVHKHVERLGGAIFISSPAQPTTVRMELPTEEIS